MNLLKKIYENNIYIYDIKFKPKKKRINIYNFFISTNYIFLIDIIIIIIKIFLQYLLLMKIIIIAIIKNIII